MRTPDQLFPYQWKAIEFQCDKPASALWLDMGLGKTVVTLSSIAHKINCGDLRAVLIVAPIRVCRMVWRQEALKWIHTQGLTFSMVVGDKDQRSRALMAKADIYLINYENLQWLTEALQTYYLKPKREIPFDGIVFDEISKCKNSSTQRVRALCKLLPQFKWTTGLTGTPASNGFKDLHGQYLVLDKGVRLGTSKTAFTNRWYKTCGPHKLEPYADTVDRIKEIIGDMTLEMGAADYNPLPDIIINTVEVELNSQLRAAYDGMENELFIKLDSGAEIEMFNRASLTNRCLQFSNGAMYVSPGLPQWEEIHELKLEALDDIINEANGNQILCAYAYRSDAERIMKRYHKLRPINLTECKTQTSLNNAMRRWREKDCPLMIGHPGSMGHGLDGLQDSGHIVVWFGLNWSLDYFDQFNARVRRQGQGVPVICHRILCADTLDQAQALALGDKATTQADLRRAIKKYRESRK
jgi:SNF2 family DNA or RNA helicase